jgi:ubiquinone biosynthesis protein UbiJ
MSAPQGPDAEASSSASSFDERPRTPLHALAMDAARGLQEQGLRAVITGFGYLLRQQPWARDRLRQHAGSVVRVGLRGEPPAGLPRAELLLAITAEGTFEAAPAGAEPRATLLLEPSADLLASLTRDGVEGVPRHLRIEGDVMLAATLGELARHLRWDAEEDLSRLVGDVAARRAVGLLQGAFGALRALVERPAESLGRFAAGGQAPVVTRDALGVLGAEFASLDEHLKRLEQRADRVATPG